MVSLAWVSAAPVVSCVMVESESGLFCGMWFAGVSAVTDCVRGSNKRDPDPARGQLSGSSMRLMVVLDIDIYSILLEL